MTDRSLSGLSLEQLRELDRIAAKYRGCRYADLTTTEVQELLAEMEAEAVTKEAYVIILEEWHRMNNNQEVRP